jgi:hypothetical protein
MTNTLAYWSNSQVTKKKKFCEFQPTTLHFLRNLRMAPISESVCPWQALPALCTPYLIWPIRKLGRQRHSRHLGFICNLAICHNMEVSDIYVKATFPF